MIGSEQFREIPVSQVAPAEADAAYLTLRCVARVFEMTPAPVIRWCRPTNAFDDGQHALGLLTIFEQSERIAGWAHPDRLDEVWVRAGRGPLLVARTVAHELKHIEQVRREGFPAIFADDFLAIRERWEDEAREWAELAIGTLFPEAA